MIFAKDGSLTPLHEYPMSAYFRAFQEAVI